MSTSAALFELDLKPGPLHWLIALASCGLGLCALVAAPAPTATVLFLLWIGVAMTIINALADQRWWQLTINADGQACLDDGRGATAPIVDLRGNFRNRWAILLHMRQPRSRGLLVFKYAQPESFRRLAHWLTLRSADV